MDAGHVNSIYYPSNSIPFDYSKINHLIVFGDSYSQTFLVEDTMKYTGNNSSGGKDWPLHLINLHDMYLWNFAVNGASMSDSYLQNREEFSTLIKQYDIFKAKMTKGKPFHHWESDDTLFVFWFGINDSIHTVASPEETIEQSLNIMYDRVNKIYEDGARNIMVINIPPFYNSPWGRYNKAQGLHVFVEKYNEAIQERVHTFASTHPEANVFLYRSMDEFNYILEQPQHFNIANTEETYIDHQDDAHVRLQDFFWYNYLHPSEALHQVLADDIHEFLNHHSRTKVTISITHDKALANREANHNPS